MATEEPQLPPVVSDEPALTSPVDEPQDQSLSANGNGNGVHHNEEEGGANGVAEEPPQDKDTAEGEAKNNADEPLKPKAAASSDAKPTLKKPATVKAAGGKPAAGTTPPTPLVKKILNSGTFGPGSTKAATAAPLKSSTSAANLPAKSPATSGLKKPVTSAPVATDKPTATSDKPTATSASTKPSEPVRKPTVGSTPAKPAASSTTSTAAPKPLASSSAKAAPAAKPPLTSSAKPAARPAAAAPRKSVISPTPSTGSAGRPRASISDAAVRKPLSAPRQSLPASTATRPPRASSSIAAVKEVKEDNKALEELEEKLKEAVASLSTKTERITELEVQLESAKTELAAQVTKLEEKQATFDELQKSSDVFAQELKEARASLETYIAGKDTADSQLKQTEESLRKAEASLAEQVELVKSLQGELQDLRTQIESAQSALESLKSKSEESAKEAAEAASAERASLLETNAALEARIKEAESIIASQAKELEDATEKQKALEKEVSALPGLTADLVSLRKEWQELSAKCSELEVEILELKEAGELAEDQLAKAVAQSKNLEVEMAKVIEGHAKALEEMDAARQTEVAAAIKSVQEAALVESQQLQQKLSELTADLEAQEAKYAGQLDAVKEEHEILLKQTFEKAKSEAGTAHAQELQKFRGESAASMEQIVASHQNAIADLKRTHEEELQTNVRSLEKQLSTQKLELKATQDDLLKAKTSLASATSEIGQLQTQLEAAKQEASTATASAAAVAQHAAEVQRLTKELADSQDDNEMLRQAFTASKESFEEIARNHSVELEEAAKGRVEEVQQLRANFDEEKSALLREKQALQSQLEDALEAKEKAVAQAEAAARVPTTPSKTNGVSSPALTKEELQKLHEAHNSKLSTVEAEHAKALKALREELQDLKVKVDDLEAENSRKTMEIGFMETEKDDLADEVTRLKDELEQALAQSKE